MRETIMKKNYVRAFRTVVVLAVLLAVVSAVVIPLNLSQQIRDLSALEHKTGERGEHSVDYERFLESRITSLSAANYAMLGGLAVLWLALGTYYWVLVIAWLYKNAVNEGMNKSLWPILGLFANLLAVFAFLIVRDNPRRVKAADR